MEEEIIEAMNRNYKYKQIVTKRDKIKKLYEAGNKYEKVYIYLKYKPKLNHYGGIQNV